jgi:hypothetical protein
MQHSRHLGPILLGLFACAASLAWLAGLAGTPVRAERRLDWAAIAPDPLAPLRSWRHIVIHHTASPSGSSASIDNDHLQRKDREGQGWEGIGYHFVIGNGQGMELGQIDATFRWQGQRQGAHAGNDLYNQFGIGIALIGNFDLDAPPQAQFERCAQLCALLISHLRTLSVDSITGHRDLSQTRCPGQFCDLDRLRARVRQLLPLYEARNPASP